MATLIISLFALLISLVSGAIMLILRPITQNDVDRLISEKKLRKKDLYATVKELDTDIDQLYRRMKSLEGKVAHMKRGKGKSKAQSELETWMQFQAMQQGNYPYQLPVQEDEQQSEG